MNYQTSQMINLMRQMVTLMITGVAVRMPAFALQTEYSCPVCPSTIVPELVQDIKEAVGLPEIGFMGKALKVTRVQSCIWSDCRHDHQLVFVEAEGRLAPDAYRPLEDRIREELCPETASVMVVTDGWVDKKVRMIILNP